MGFLSRFYLCFFRWKMDIIILIVFCRVVNWIEYVIKLKWIMFLLCGNKYGVNEFIFVNDKILLLLLFRFLSIKKMFRR